MTSRSAIYVGRLAHARTAPKRHAFSLPIYFLFLDLEEQEQRRSSWLFGNECFRPVAFHRKDYLGRPERPLTDEVRDEVERALRTRPLGPIRLLTQVRSFGFVFNPVSFYYCYEPDGETLTAVVAEITNTPWGERHRYVLPASVDGVVACFAKAFHVSPFFPMQQEYEWKFNAPAESLTVAMSNHEIGRKVFTASLSLKRRALTSQGLLRVALVLPLMSMQTLAAIYIHALALWLKGTPVYEHPARRAERALKDPI